MLHWFPFSFFQCLSIVTKWTSDSPKKSPTSNGTTLELCFLLITKWSLRPIEVRSHPPPPLCGCIVSNREYAIAFFDTHVPRDIITLLTYFCHLEMKFRSCTISSIKNITHDTKLFTVAIPSSCHMSVPIGHHVSIRPNDLGRCGLLP